MTTRRAAVGAASALVALGLVAVPAMTTPSRPEAPTPSAGSAAITAPFLPVANAAERRSADDAVNRVVAISVDGLNPSALRKLGPSGTPNFHRLIRQGTSTLNARTAREQTRTLPNHTSMLTGRRVDERHGGHGISANSDRSGRTVHRAAGHYVTSVFDVVHDRGGSTALFTAKKKFALYQRTWNRNGAPDRVGRNHGRAKIDRFRVDTNNRRLVQRVTADLRRTPRQFTFVHLSLPDEAGHDHGFMGADYLRAVRTTDRLLGQILGTVSARPVLREQTLVVLTADHGGDGEGHDDPRRRANYRVPFLVWGPGVPAGRNLYSCSPSFRNPGSARTDYRGRQPVRNGDLANLVTDVLDLPRVRGSEFNKRQHLNPFC